MKKFVVTGSIVAAMGDPAIVKGTAYRSERRLCLLRSDFGLDSEMYFHLQIGIQ